MKTFTLAVLAAEKPFYEGDCISLVIPTVDGLYGIQAGHSNMIAAIVPGVLKYTTPDGNEHIAALSEGMVKVEDNHVLLLVNTAERPEEIDENRARRAAEEAKEAILQRRSIQDYHAAQVKLRRAISRLNEKKHKGNR